MHSAQFPNESYPNLLHGITPLIKLVRSASTYQLPAQLWHIVSNGSGSLMKKVAKILRSPGGLETEFTVQIPEPTSEYHYNIHLWGLPFWKLLISLKNFKKKKKMKPLSQISELVRQPFGLLNVQCNSYLTYSEFTKWSSQRKTIVAWSTVPTCGQAGEGLQRLILVDIFSSSKEGITCCASSPAYLLPDNTICLRVGFRCSLTHVVW